MLSLRWQAWVQRCHEDIWQETRQTTSDILLNNALWNLYSTSNDFWWNNLHVWVVPFLAMWYLLVGKCSAYLKLCALDLRCQWRLLPMELGSMCRILALLTHSSLGLYLLEIKKVSYYYWLQSCHHRHDYSWTDGWTRRIYSWYLYYRELLAISNDAY